MARPGRAVRAMAGALDEDSQTDTGEYLVAMWLHGRLSQLEWSDPRGVGADQGWTKIPSLEDDIGLQ